MKKLMSVVLAVCVLLSVTGCGAVKELLGAGGGSSVVKAEDGQADGRMGDTMRNEFFEYTVVSAQYVDSYAGYKPQTGNVLIDSVIKIKNVFGEELNMYYDDFQIQWGEGELDFGYPLDPLDNTMLPAEFMMARGLTEEYHAVYEVPAGKTEYSISYQEYFDDDTTGDVFFVYFELK